MTDYAPHDPGEFRWYRTEAGSEVTVRKGRGFSVEFDWLEESENGNACVECEVDPDATRDFNYQTLIWRCPHCGGGSATLDPFTP